MADMRKIAPHDRWKARRFMGSYQKLLTGREPEKPRSIPRKSKRKPRQGELPLADDERNRP